MKFLLFLFILSIPLVGTLIVANPSWQKQIIASDPYPPTLCFPSGTTIQTPSGTSPIEQLKIGDEVIGVSPVDHIIKIQHVTSLFKSQQSSIYDLAFSSGKQVSVTKMHPFAVWNEEKTAFSFIPVKELKQGMKVASLINGKTLEEDTITSITSRYDPTEVYNLSVEPDKTFIAEGIVVHNKESPCGINGCGYTGSCGGAPCPAVGSGMSYNGTNYTVVETSDGKVYAEADPNNENDNGKGGVGGTDPSPPPTPPVTPPPGTGTINAVAISAQSSSLTTCMELEQVKTCLDTPPGTGCSAQYLNGTQFYLNSQGPVTQDDSSGVQFTPVAAAFAWYLSTSYPLGGWSPYLYCRKTTNPDSPYTVGPSVYMEANMTADFLVGFGPLYPWLQVRGGGNTFGDTVTSLMPLMLSPTLLFDNTTPSTPGILSSLNGVDLFDSWTSPGTQNISSTNWNTNNGMTSKDWYKFFKTRLSQGIILPYEENGDKPAMVEGASVTVYTTKNLVDGELLIKKPWIVGEGEKLIILVEGTLDIRSTITLQGNGFVAFVVKDDITINSSVGTTWDSETPVVEGVYVAGGAITTGRSTDPATIRFVGKGIFVGNEITGQRNLGIVNNQTTAADLFIYNPSLLISMPNIIRSLSYEWQEVAP